jgi:hypothetical protein
LAISLVVSASIPKFAEQTSPHTGTSLLIIKASYELP